MSYGAGNGVKIFAAYFWLATLGLALIWPREGSEDSHGFMRGRAVLGDSLEITVNPGKAKSGHPALVASYRNLARRPIVVHLGCSTVHLYKRAPREGSPPDINGHEFIACPSILSLLELAPAQARELVSAIRFSRRNWTAGARCVRLSGEYHPVLEVGTEPALFLAPAALTTLRLPSILAVLPDLADRASRARPRRAAVRCQSSEPMQWHRPLF
jgi:hypothetical protein